MSKVCSSSVRWPLCRRELIAELDAEAASTGMLLTHAAGCWDRGVEIWQVSDGGLLEGIVNRKDQLMSVDGVSTASFIHANRLLSKPGSHRCVLRRARSAEEERHDRWVVRVFCLLCCIALGACIDLPQRTFALLARHGIVSYALPGGAERVWDEHLVVVSIGTTARRALHLAQLYAALVIMPSPADVP